MKRIISVLLVALMLLSLAACDFDYAGKLVGTWECQVEESDEQKAALMEQIELYEEEIALVDSTLYTVKTLTFTEDGTYEFNEDPDGVKMYVRQFFKDVFKDMYEGRAGLASLTDDYGVDLSQLSEDEFYAFYAELYGYATLDEMLDGFATEIYDYDSFESNDHGTFTATSKYIDFDATDDELDGSVTYKLTDSTLTITYSDDTEIYTKSN